MRTPSLTAFTRWRSPDSDSPSSARVATPQWTSVCTSRTRLDIGPLPFPHGDLGALSRRGDDLELVHQTARTRETEAETARRGIAVLHRPRDVANPWAVVFGYDDDPLVGAVQHLGEAHLAPLRIHPKVARDLGDRRGDDGLVSAREAELRGQLATRLAGLDDVGVCRDETAEIVSHGRCVHALADCRCARALGDREMRGPLRGRGRWRCL